MKIRLLEQDDHLMYIINSIYITLWNQMSGKFRDKNLLFFYQGHPESDEFIQELGKNEPLKKQFILVNMRDPKINLPPKIATINQPLILFANGAGEPLTNKEALFWLKNNGFSDQANGWEFMDMGTGSLAPAMLDEIDKKPVKIKSATRGPMSYSLVAERNELDAGRRPNPAMTMNFAR